MTGEIREQISARRIIDSHMKRVACTVLYQSRLQMVGLFIEASADAEEKISEQQTANCFLVELQPFPLEYTVIA